MAGMAGMVCAPAMSTSLPFHAVRKRVWHDPAGKWKPPVFQAGFMHAYGKARLQRGGGCTKRTARRITGIAFYREGILHLE